MNRPDMVVLVGLGGIVGLLLVVMVSFGVVYAALRAVVALAAPGGPSRGRRGAHARRPSVRIRMLSPRHAQPVVGGPAPTSAEHWTAHY